MSGFQLAFSISRYYPGHYANYEIAPDDQNRHVKVIGESRWKIRCTRSQVVNHCCQGDSDQENYDDLNSMPSVIVQALRLRRQNGRRHHLYRRLLFNVRAMSFLTESLWLLRWLKAFSYGFSDSRDLVDVMQVDQSLQHLSHSPFDCSSEDFSNAISFADG
jgi:hypothetical protein